MDAKALLESLLPPVVLRLAHAMRRGTTPDGTRLEHAPQGWDTPIGHAAGGYEAPGAVEGELRDWLPFMRALPGSRAPLVTCDAKRSTALQAACDHNTFMTFAYVLARSAHEARYLRVLDYGSSLGYFHLVARALMPEVTLDYHCRELPAMARAGRDAHPDATWHSDDECLAQRYDLVMASGSLQYVREWRDLLRRMSVAASRYVYVTDIPVVESSDSYVLVQHHAGATMLQQVFNKAELLTAFEQSGLRLLREFWVGPHMHVARAPEQPAYYGCLLQPGGALP